MRKRHFRNLAAKALLLLMLTTCPPGVRPADVSHLSVTYHDHEFIVAAELGLRASRTAVFNVLADYARWGRLNRNIIESRIVSVAGVRQHRVLSLTRACLLFFCRDIRQTQDVTEIGDGELIAVTVPEPDNLRQGLVHWRLDAEGGQTRVHLFARLAPDFWLPPLIGPWSIKAVLREEVLETAVNLERFARSTTGEQDGEPP